MSENESVAPSDPAVKPQKTDHNGNYVTQERKNYRKNWPTWMKQLPKFQFDPPNTGFRLIDRDKMRQILTENNASPAAIQRLEEDMDFLDHELERLFRLRDYAAAKQQNRYRLYQLGYTLLAALASIIGAFQALAVNDNPDLMPYLAFGETVVALFTTFLATISGRGDPPMHSWLENRRHAEYLRREYFRYLMDLPPYDTLTGFERKQQLSIRAANINRGVYPDASAN